MSNHRKRIHELADDLGASIDEVLMASARRDPLNKGTSADHAKAEWFAGLWEQAVADRMRAAQYDKQPMLNVPSIWGINLRIWK